MNGEELVVNELEYLKVMISEYVSGKAEIERSIFQGRKIVGELKALVNGNNISVECVRRLHSGFIVPTPLCGCETLDILSSDRKNEKVRN